MVGPPVAGSPPSPTSSSSSSPAQPSSSTSPHLSSTSYRVPAQPSREYSLKILQWNANGLGNKVMEFKELLARLGIHVALLQETKLRPLSKTPSFPGYTPIRVDRPSGDGGGAAFLPW